MPFLNWILFACSLGLAAWAGLRTARDQPVVFKQLIVAGGILVLLFATMIVAGIQLGRGHEIADGVTFWGYFIAAALLFPLAGVWAIAERTRWSSVVLIVAGVAFAVVQLRLLQLWGTLGAITQIGAP
ncbi:MULTISPECIES: hypothetical protein [unclassified Pseudactinotalea]|uniref:hypothetical protein n=1 Tax=unclassified Pseudactinotalea TaxID=2649176 RepID=UPI00128C0B2C|nr:MULTISPECIES: hypothetical protein [unclassified Pseudactinotalea]MPV50035.1 hypothetical protein [Pseudactinotalea sp. HY160]QGH69486.1 hypothetical protein GCE65_08100 [Pseudactinotalea sp. HY158]